MVIKGQRGQPCPQLDEALKDDWEPLNTQIINDAIFYTVRKQVWAQPITIEMVGEPELGHSQLVDAQPDLVIPSLTELQDKLKKETVKRGKKAR